MGPSVLPLNASRSALVALLLLVTTLAALPAGASSPREEVILEGERFDAADADCDPDFDGERTTEASLSPERPERRVFLPHSGCGVTFYDVPFDRDPLVDSVRVGIGGADTSFRFRVDVYIGGDKVGDFLGDARPQDQMVTLSPSFLAWAPSGVHDVRVDYTITEGPSYGNLELDHIGFVLQEEATGHLVNGTKTHEKCPELRVLPILGPGPYTLDESILFQVEGGDPSRDYSWEASGTMSQGIHLLSFEAAEPGLHSIRVSYADGGCEGAWSEPYRVEVVDLPDGDMEGMPQDGPGTGTSLLGTVAVFFAAPLILPMLLELAPVFLIGALLSEG